MEPFLRWAGGKTWFIKHLQNYLPKNGFNNYHEPFLGGGSVFFSLQTKKSFLSDLNEDLILTYKEIRDNVNGVINELIRFKNTEKDYYMVRDIQKFSTPSEKAARFIFLNQTSFNGIYRVNLSGKYNVPYGFRTKNFYQPENLLSASAALKNSEIFACDFTRILPNIHEGDLVFLDPPYTVSHYNNGFIKYNSKLFSEQDQKKLSQLIHDIKEIGAFYIMTNADHYLVHEIFEENRDQYKTEERASLIGGKHSKRGIYHEAIYSNIL